MIFAQFVIENFILDPLLGGGAAPVQPGRRPQRGGRPGHQEGGEAQADEGAGKGMGCRPQSCFPTQQVPTRPSFPYMPGVQVQPRLPSLSQRTVGAWLVQAWMVANTLEARKLCPIFGKNLNWIKMFS